MYEFFAALIDLWNSLATIVGAFFALFLWGVILKGWFAK